MAKKVKTKWVVAIPEGAVVRVKVGEEVEADGDLLEINESEIKMVNISHKIDCLNKVDKKKLLEMLPGMEINDKEVVYKTRGIFPKKIILPVNGKVVKIDEFENLHFMVSGDKTRTVKCPVKAKVVKVEDQSLEMEFRAMEYVGRGINEGKAWGLNGVGFSDDMVELSSKDSGKIMLTENIDQTWLLKAEVVGVSGVVVIDSGNEEKSDRINFKLPILALEKDEWEDLKTHVGDGGRAMINTVGGRLLLVI